MTPSTRMVCGDCLRSLELFPDEQGRLPALCPVCGGTIDSKLSEIETSQSDFTIPMPHEAETREDTSWSETWSRGTLGTIGRFHLRELLGDGGFGSVYHAYDPRLDRDVALKVLKQPNPGERVMQRFFREARATARLSHPNIVAVHDAGTEAGRCWIAYQYVEGQTLARLADQQKIDIASAVRITHDLAGALNHAHRMGVYHRDLKPANVVVDPTGQPHLIDFGLARRAGLDSDLTQEGAVLGTPAYMSPEQASGRSHLADERSDVYSLGVMLFELICGRRPGDSSSSLMAWPRRPAQPAPSLRGFNPDVPAALEAIVMKALAVDPLERYACAESFARDLDRWLRSRGGPVRLSLPLAGVLLGLAGVVLLVAALRGGLSRVEPGQEPPSATTKATETKTAAKAIERPWLASRNATPPIPRAQAPKASPSEGREGPVFRIHENKRYHFEDCKHLKDRDTADLKRFEDAAAAIRAGLLPCSDCKSLGARHAIP